ncbi:OxPP cycle protein OpcA [Gordonia effusa NBRC 100432]|uniref:OxPP cycle protein OpcA n=1 Tax=Gordonia effusa NBRC 100432 TaxID=1077974 RepID=H0QZE0_9ACTN|nr:glucose-6-phosphate dehydrogenase assembly protein OpcA [Gordonia effusa]GAB18191.1 OxPP cycle protein OpcA [Gordonia effusa NBRC 100432]
MIKKLPDTSTTEVSKTLVKMRDTGGAVTLGRVLTLIVKTEKGDDLEAAIAAANDASREHPCRVIVVAAEDRKGETRLDGEIRVGGDAGASEVVVLNLFGELANHAHAVVIPFLLPDTPVVTWWPGTAPANPAKDRLGRLSQRRILDGTNRFDSAALLNKRIKSYSPGDTDIAWAQITPWRAILAAVFDQEGLTAKSARVSAPGPSVGLDLLGGWVQASLNVPVERVTGELVISVDCEQGPVALTSVGKDTIVTTPGRPPGRVPWQIRTVGECLAEELRRLDADEIYELALHGTTRLIRNQR